MRKCRAAGQSTIEFAASSLVLILIFVGLVDLGRVFYFDVGLTGATREGARQAAWFDPSTGTNPLLDDADIKAAVDGILTRSGLPASTLMNGSITCPDPADANTLHNPPYTDTAYATATPNQPLLFICYSNQPGLDLASPPADNGYKGTDVNVILVMQFGSVTGLMQAQFGSLIRIVSNTHMTVGGY
ncbi:MAG TPA: TadE family protein [Candidatus Dormibacteraeota bacterium]